MRLVRYFHQSAGALLLALGMALGLSWEASRELAPPPDPLLLVSLPVLHGLVGLIAVLLAGVCLFRQRSPLAVAGVLWLAVNFWVYVLGLRWTGTQSLNSVWGNVPDTFGLSAGTAGVLAQALFGYLLVGSGAVLAAGWRAQRHRPPPAGDCIKISCRHCGGHIAFPVSRSGQPIACPHCDQNIVLAPP